MGYGHVVEMLKLVREQESLSSFTNSLESVRLQGGDINPGNSGRAVAEQLLVCMSAIERWKTALLCSASTVMAIGQDERDSALLVLCRAVLWKLPRELQGEPYPDGVRSVLPQGMFGNALHTPPHECDACVDAYHWMRITGGEFHHWIRVYTTQCV